MGKLLLASAIFATGGYSLARPWLGIASYYLLALLGPQYIWWWNFEGLRVSFLVALFTLAGIGLKVFRNQCDFRFLATRQNYWLLLLWLFITASYFWGPYVSLYGSAGRDPQQIYLNTIDIFLFYFCATLAIDSEKSLRYLALVLVVSTAYLIYWANLQYFTANWAQFKLGRLMGPRSVDGGSIYSDENGFAMSFVTGLPFIYYFGCQTGRKWLRYGLWCLIPLGWHAVFLTGSRGGLLGLGTVTLLIVLKSKRRALAIPMLLSFLVFYQWQAGNTMKERSETISNYQGESSAEQRLTAWKGGVRMIAAHPLIGVGLGSFITALPSFIECNPRVAHNTFIQYTAESGIGAGCSFLMLSYLFFVNARRISARCRERDDAVGRKLENFNDASSTSFAGFIICSLFLSLNTYEVFFYLLIFNNSLAVICLAPEVSHAEKPLLAV